MGLMILDWMNGLNIKHAVRKDGGLGCAVFSWNGLHRYALARRWKDGGRTACFIMMNASTADENTDDMTIRKVTEFSKIHGCNALYAVNLGAYIAKDPRKLLRARDPVGPKNRMFIGAAADSSDLVVVAWGAMPERIWDRFRESVDFVKSLKGLKCLGRTKTGAPHHPSRIAYATALEDWP